MALGLITLNNGENVVSGEGTAFSHDLTSGDFICTRVGGILYTLAIGEVNSDTEATLVKAYEGPTATGLAWYAVPRKVQNQVTAELVAQNTEALRRANANDANYQQLLTEEGDVTIETHSGVTFSGPSWLKIVSLVEVLANRITPPNSTEQQLDHKAQPSGSQLAREQPVAINWASFAFVPGQSYRVSHMSKYSPLEGLSRSESTTWQVTCLKAHNASAIVPGCTLLVQDEQAQASGVFLLSRHHDPEKPGGAQWLRGTLPMETVF